MNVNGSRYHLLLGKEDWGRCAIVRGSRHFGLLEKWGDDDAAADPRLPAYVPGWDRARNVLTLAQIFTDVPETRGESPLTASVQRSPAADRHGNIYLISADGRGIDVVSNGTGTASAFWPGPVAERSGALAGFVDAEERGDVADTISALTVTSEDYLIAGTNDHLLRFDLFGGGPPERFVLPIVVPAIKIDGLAPMTCGGVWLLDGHSARLFRLTRDLAFARDDQNAGNVAAFQPEGGGDTRTIAVALPAFLDLSGEIAPMPPLQPIALAALATGHALLLNDGPKTTSWLRVITPDGKPLGDAIKLRSRYFALAARNDGTPHHLMFAHVNGNQARGATLELTETGFSLSSDPTTIPLRRFGGRGLISSLGKFLYDTGSPEYRWVPVVAQKRQTYAIQNQVVTPVLDSGEPHCVWDRIRLDACIPTGTGVRFEARASDDLSALRTVSGSGWIAQPLPYLNGDGGELAGKRRIAQAATDPLRQSGCWDLLLQNVSGRYLELRISLTGDGRFTPHLRALRVWYPRFSYAERFLPGVYREEPIAASFLERFLANMEGINSVAEGRIADVQTLFDTRTAPDDMLDWLAGWFDMALDPRWEDHRRRLFIKFAPQFFNWRGTIRGLGRALRIAFEPGLTEEDFDPEAPDTQSASSVRIIEQFALRGRLRPVSRASLATVVQPLGDRQSGTWSVGEGNAGLIQRWTAVVAESAPDTQKISGSFPLSPITGLEQEWANFVQTHLGFVPIAGAREQQRLSAYRSLRPDGSFADFASLPSSDRVVWVRYLKARHRHIAAFNARLGDQKFARFDDVPIPHLLPSHPILLEDWLSFEGQALPIAHNAHRFAVLLPRLRVDFSVEKERQELALAERIIAIEKPAHTVFDVRFHWAMNRVGEARIGSDTHLGQGSRAPELIPPALLGQAYIGVNFVNDADDTPRGRTRLAC